jgi:hypothetical protein
MKSKQEGSATSAIIFIGAVVILPLIGMAGYFLYESQQNTVVSPSSVENAIPAIPVTTGTQTTAVIPLTTATPIPTTSSISAQSKDNTSELAAPNTETNCGTTYYLANPHSSYSTTTADIDATLLCLGNAIINSCTPTEVTSFSGSDIAPTQLQTIDQGGVCEAKITVTTGIYAQCAINSITEGDSNQSLASLVSADRNAPGVLGFSVLFGALTYPITDDANCTGPYNSSYLNK